MTRAEKINEILTRQRRIKKAVNEGVPEVGIFWYFQGQIIQSSLPYTEGVDIGDGYINGPADHYLYWEQAKKWNSAIRDYEYDEVPRGRVIYNSNQRKFIVRISRALNSSNILSMILREFSLRSANTKVVLDDHYELVKPDELDWT